MSKKETLLLRWDSDYPRSAAPGSKLYRIWADNIDELMRHRGFSDGEQIFCAQSLTRHLSMGPVAFLSFHSVAPEALVVMPMSGLDTLTIYTRREGFLEPLHQRQIRWALQELGVDVPPSKPRVGLDLTYLPSLAGHRIRSKNPQMSLFQ